MQLFTENVVVTANLFNVSLIQQVWLVDNGIVSRGEFTGPMLFTPGMVQFETPSFVLLVIPGQVQLQFVPNCPEESKQQIVSDRLGRMINLLPHTPYSAIGVNFTWHYKPAEPRTVAEVSRQAFYRSDIACARLLDSPDAKFGAYYSKDAIGFRLKLTIAPISFSRPDGITEDVLQFAFNYHRDAANTAVLLDAITHWSDAKEHSTILVREMEATL